MTSADVAEILDLAELVLRLDLQGPDDRDHLVAQLRAVRADHLDALTRPDPVGVSASMLHLRSVRWAEIEIAEAALDQLGEEYAVDEGGDDD